MSYTDNYKIHSYLNIEIITFYEPSPYKENDASIDFVIGFMCFSLALGKASALLPIYHYAFTTYSCAIAELIAGTDTELYTKTDLRFMEGCYKVYKHML